MKKLSVMFITAVALSCTAFSQGIDGIAVTLKTEYDNVSGTGTVSAVTSDVIRIFGSQEVLDMCMANGWKASPIAKALKGKRLTASTVTAILYLPDNERWDFAKTIADGYCKVTAVYYMTQMDFTMPDDVSYVFSINDGSETNCRSSLFLTDYFVNKSISVNKMINSRTASIVDLVDFLLLGGSNKHVGDMDWAKNQIKTMAVPYLKRSLRAKGKSFVTKDGVNPVEVGMKAVVDALNTPKLQGLEAALRGIGVDITDIPRAPKIWDAINAEKDAIFYGDKPAHPEYDGGIMLLLGPDGYNTWVKEFNGGK